MDIKTDNPVKQKYFDYLEELRQSGETNMYGTARYLEREFPELQDTSGGFHSGEAARRVLGEWIDGHK